MSLPFPLRRKVDVDASLDPSGQLTARVKYTMRGENELLLRVAFHQSLRKMEGPSPNFSPISDGFRGKVTSVTASDPSATREPFTSDYEINRA